MREQNSEIEKNIQEKQTEKWKNKKIEENIKEIKGNRGKQSDAEGEMREQNSQIAENTKSINAIWL